MDQDDSIDTATNVAMDTGYDNLAVARDALISDFLGSRLTAAELVQELSRLAPPEPRRLDLGVDLDSDRSVDLTQLSWIGQQRTRARHGV
jgi:hypothetical protein